MRNYRKKKVKGAITTGVLILTFSAVMLSGCAKSEKKEEATSSSSNWDKRDMKDVKANATDTTAVDVEEFSINKEIKEEYYADTVDANATVLEKGCRIDKAGTYILSGDIEDGQLSVNVSGDEFVRIILNNAKISCSSGPAINVIKGNVILTLAEGSDNSISDGSSYSDEELTACIYSEDNLSINGSGKLNITANYKNAIQSKKNLYILDGNINLTSVNDGIKGKKSVYVMGGKIEAKTADKAIQATGASQDEGYVYIAGGELNISSDSSDGIKAETIVEIDGGKINIEKSEEGIEALYIRINDGIIDVCSSDDGINASDGSGGDGTKPVIYLNGGEVSVNAAGDGLDSNGYIYMNGGTVTVDGPENDGNGYFDYSQEFVVNGGTLMGAGSSGMLELPTQSSKQNVITAVATEEFEGVTASLKDSSGKTIMEVSPKKRFKAVTFSGKDIVNGETYTVYFGDKETGSVKVETTTSTIGEVSSRGGFGGRKGKGGRPDGEMPNGERPDRQRPDGMTPPDGEGNGL